MTTEKSWENPQVGDVLTMRDGRKRTVAEVIGRYARTWVRCRGEARWTDDPVWIATAAVEDRRGGSYVRAGGAP